MIFIESTNTQPDGPTVKQDDFNTALKTALTNHLAEYGLVVQDAQIDVSVSYDNQVVYKSDGTCDDDCDEVCDDGFVHYREAASSIGCTLLSETVRAGCPYVMFEHMNGIVTFSLEDVLSVESCESQVLISLNNGSDGLRIIDVLMLGEDAAKTIVKDIFKAQSHGWAH